MSDEQLIELVKRYPVLYDMNLTQYRDHSIRNNAWEEIAEELHNTVEQCKERWGKLRNCFTNALKRRHKKSGQASIKIVPWKFEAQMDFLLSHVEGRRTTTNLSTDKNEDLTQDLTFSEDPDSPHPNEMSSTPSPSTQRILTPKEPTPGSSSVRTPTPRELTPTPSLQRTSNRNMKESDNNILKEMVDIMKYSQESRQDKRMAEMDETDYFFLAMSKQLKKLPKLDQTSIKFQMHKLIHDAEIKQLNKNEQVLKTPLIVTRKQTAQNSNTLFPNIIQNRAILYPNTSYLNTSNTGPLYNTQNIKNTQHVRENVVICENVPTPNNTVEVDAEEIENETEASLKAYFNTYKTN